MVCGAWFFHGGESNTLKDVGLATACEACLVVRGGTSTEGPPYCEKEGQKGNVANHDSRALRHACVLYAWLATDCTALNHGMTWLPII